MRRNKHEWDYMGRSKITGDELGYCGLCKKHRVLLPDGRYTIISKTEFDKIRDIDVSQGGK